MTGTHKRPTPLPTPDPTVVVQTSDGPTFDPTIRIINDDQISPVDRVNFPFCFNAYFIGCNAHFMLQHSFCQSINFVIVAFTLVLLMWACSCFFCMYYGPFIDLAEATRTHQTGSNINNML